MRVKGSSAGFSLIETVMVFGLIGFGGVIIAQLVQNSAKSQRSVVLTGDREELRTLVALTLRSQGLCTAAFQGQSFPAPATGLTQLKLPGITIQPGSVVESLKILSMDLQAQGATPADTYTDGGNPYSIYVAKLTLKVQKQGQVAGASESSFSSFLNIVVPGIPPASPAAIAGCFGESSVTLSKLEVCQMLGGTFLAGPPPSCDSLNLRMITLGSPTAAQPGTLNVWQGGSTGNYGQIYGSTVTSYMITVPVDPNRFPGYSQMYGTILTAYSNDNFLTMIDGASYLSRTGSGNTQIYGPTVNHW